MNYIWIFVLTLLIIFLVYFLVIHNKFVKLNNIYNEAFATMDVYLKKRWDLIPNLVEVVKGYAKHEKDTLKEVVELRNGVYDDLSLNDKIKTNEQINKSVSKLVALVEDYPKLKADEQFKTLSKELSKIEDEIAQSRKYYNAVVRNFNDMVEMIPSNVVAKVLRYKTKTMFMANDNERENVKVEL